VANEYKVTAGKPPVVRAVFIPFGRTLLALAAMMERQAVRHKLQGAKDPYQEWRQLPNAKEVLTDAGGRHALDPWTLNTKDAVGDHPGDLHVLHAIWGLMAGHEKHLEEQDHARSREAVLARELASHRAALFPVDQDLCCDAPDAVPLHGPAGADWRESVARSPVTPRCQASTHGHQCHKPQGHDGAHSVGQTP
jgi:hypothetical protein